MVARSFGVRRSGRLIHAEHQLEAGNLGVHDRWLARRAIALERASLYIKRP